MIDTVNTRKALDMLMGFTDKEIEVKPIEEFRAPGLKQPITYLGITQLSDNCFRIYLSTEYPEAILIHEILHIILRYEGFPVVGFDETCAERRLPQPVRDCLPVLAGRLVSTVDHPEIHRRMENDYDLDMDRYYRIHAERETDKIIRESGLTLEHDDHVFVCQQNILSCLDFLLWGKPHAGLLDTLSRHYPEVFNSSQTLRRDVARTGFSTPLGAFKSANIIKSHIVNYGKRRFMRKEFTLMWKSLTIAFDKEKQMSDSRKNPPHPWSHSGGTS